MMKLINSLKILSFGLIFVVSSCGRNNQDNVVSAPSASIIAVDYNIEGMVCAMGCAKTIEKEVQNMQGISLCNVNYEEGKAHIEYDKGYLTEEDIITKIEGIARNQYKVTPIEKEVEDDSTNEETLESVSLSTFEIPNLFTFLIDQL